MQKMVTGSYWSLIRGSGYATAKAAIAIWGDYLASCHLGREMLQTMGDTTEVPFSTAGLQDYLGRAKHPWQLTLVTRWGGEARASLELAEIAVSRKPVETHDDIRPILTTVGIVENALRPDQTRVREFLETAERLFELLRPVYALAHARRDQHRVAGGAIDARQLDHYLPGIFWANLLSQGMVETIGLATLQSLPWFEVRPISQGGMLLLLTSTPWDAIEDRGRQLALQIQGSLRSHIRQAPPLPAHLPRAGSEPRG